MQVDAVDFKKKKFVVPPSGGSVGRRNLPAKAGTTNNHFLEYYVGLTQKMYSRLSSLLRSQLPSLLSTTKGLAGRVYRRLDNLRYMDCVSPTMVMKLVRRIDDADASSGGAMLRLTMLADKVSEIEVAKCETKETDYKAGFAQRAVFFRVDPRTQGTRGEERKGV